MKRLLFFILCIASASPGFAGEQEGDVVTLRISGLPNPSDISPNGIAHLRVVDAFLKQNPNIRLKNAEGIRIENMVSQVTTIMMVAGGIAPDVISMNFRSMDSFVSQGMVAPLDDHIAEELAKGNDIVSGIPRQIRDVVYRPDAQGKKRLYGLPLQLLTTGIYYNKELFRLAGLPLRAPEDWDELTEFAEKITALDPHYKGLHLTSGSAASHGMMSFLWSAGAEAVEETAPNEWRAVFNSKEAVEAYAYYYYLTEIKRVVNRAAGGLTEQERSRFGMFFAYIGDNIKFDPELYGLGPVPKGPTGIRGSEVNAPLLGIFSGIKDPQVREAAWKYVLFMSSEEAERIRTDTMVELGQANLINPVLLKKFGYEQFLALSPPGLEESFQEALDTGKPEPYGKNCNLVYNEMTLPLDQILLNDSIRRDWEAGNIDSAKQQMQEILNRAVTRTNERMIGYVAPEVMKFRRIVAAIVVTTIFVLFLWALRYVGRVFLRSSAMISRPVNSRSIIPWLCLAPALLLIIVWSYIPLMRGTVIAFQDYQIILESTFIGLDNFAGALFDPSFWGAILATIHFAAYTLTLGFAAPILLAYALHLIPKHKIFYRTVYYLPSVISFTAVFFLWRELFSTDGPLNEILRLFGFEARRAWTEDPYKAMLSCIIPGIWAGAGPGCLIYLAALKTIPEEQFEAAEIDGASFLQKTLKIVYPGLRALIFINFVGAVAASFHGATNILIMTGGGPNGITEVASLKIFFEAFARLRFGPATAMAWILGSMLIGFTVIQLKRLSQMEFKTAK